MPQMRFPDRIRIHALPLLSDPTERRMPDLFQAGRYGLEALPLLRNCAGGTAETFIPQFVQVLEVFEVIQTGSECSAVRRNGGRRAAPFQPQFEVPEPQRFIEVQPAGQGRR